LSRSVLVLLNRSAGTGHAENVSDQVADSLKKGFGAPLDVSTKVVDDHPGVRSAAAAFVPPRVPRWLSRPEEAALCARWWRE